MKFLDLPGELRNAVYNLLLPRSSEKRYMTFENDLGRTGIKDYNDCNHNLVPGPLHFSSVLARTCKQVQKELMTLLLDKISIRLVINNLRLDTVQRFHAQSCEDPSLSLSPASTMRLPLSLLTFLEKLTIWNVLPRFTERDDSMNL